MPISKKDRIHREHKKADAAGTRVPVKKNGNPVKAPKPKSICQNCRKEMVRDNLKQMSDHAGTHAAAWTPERCFPDDFQAAPAAAAAEVAPEPVEEPAAVA